MCCVHFMSFIVYVKSSFFTEKHCKSMVKKNYFYNDIYVNFATFPYFTEQELSRTLQPTEVYMPQYSSLYIQKILTLSEEKRYLRQEGQLLYTNFIEKNIYFQYCLAFFIPFI